ncbi:MAG: 2-isopropylmalate synthase [Saccharofermentanales bacterium]
MSTKSRENCKKYSPFEPITMNDRRWPDKSISAAPVWCSVDLRDGNQSLVIPMNLDEKLAFFELLCDIGFKEIEVGFPSASETEYTILRTLIEGGHIPDDVAVQVLVQAREHLIVKTFESLKNARKAIFHFYNSTSTLQRKVVYKTDMRGVTEIAVNGAKIIAENAKKAIEDGMDLRFEYSPESFSGTEIDFSIEICSKVMKILNASPENKIILNLPATVEMSSPNGYADQIEYFCRNLPDRENAIISIHPHNDRGTAVAASELALMAGADRVEGTLFGNGERTGNVDLLTIALNMFTQGIDPGIDIFNLNRIKETYENCTKMQVHQRHPYAGELVFTAFSGSHQDAISKGYEYMKASGSDKWEIPYLPIDPADLGREYEPVIRINSQSGKGGAAFVLQSYYGLFLPKAMHPEFGRIVKKASDDLGGELTKEDIYSLFEKEYLDIMTPYSLKNHKISDQSGDLSGNQSGDLSRSAESNEMTVRFEGTILHDSSEYKITGKGNGPIDAFIKALSDVGLEGYEIISYDEHAITKGSDSKAAAYIQLADKNGDKSFGVGISSNINLASIKSIISAINRMKR